MSDARNSGRDHWHQVSRDLKLGRDVAIKVLPSSFAADAERLRVGH